MEANESLVQTIFKDFLVTVDADTEIEQQIKDRLRKAFLEEKDLTQKNLKEILLGEDTLP